MRSENTAMSKFFLYAALTVGVIISLFPFYWMIVGATNPSSETFTYPPKLIPGSHLAENFANLTGSIDIFSALTNSLIIALVFVILSLFISVAAGYAFAKFTFKGSEVIFGALLLSMMIPYQATVIPLFQMFSSVGWLNSYAAVIAPQLAYPFAIFLIRQNMKGIPNSLLEAARIDGAGEFYIFFKLVLPLMKPALAAVGIFLFTFQWNNFMWPLIVMTTQENYTLPVALSTLVGVTNTDYGQLMLGTAISVLPILIVFLFLQKHFVSGILGGSVKE